MIDVEKSYDVVLLPTFAQVEHWRKHAASRQGRGLFSQTATTFNAWIADLWELHGDGRAIVDSLQRQVVMQAAFEREPEGPLVTSPGGVKLAAQCARAASGLAPFERALNEARAGTCPAGVCEREAALLSGIARYRDLLAEAGLIELGCAAACLAGISDAVFARPTRVLVAEAAPPDWIAQGFFDSCGRLFVDVQLAAGQEGVPRAPEKLDLRFGFPSGRYAQCALVVDLVRDALAHDGRAPAGGVPLMVVACKDPLDMFKQAESALAEAGAVGCVQAQEKFSSTDFGRQFLLAAYSCSDDTWSKDGLSDAASPPFSGFDINEALDIDKRLRADRLARREDCLLGLCMESDRFSQLEELAGDPEADILLGVFEQIAFTSPGRSDAWRAEQLTAAAALRSCTTAARRVGASMQSCLRVLEDAFVTLSYEAKADDAPKGNLFTSAAPASPNGRGERPRIVFTTQAAAARMGASACDQLILCDLTSDDYPVADKDDAAATLFAKLGLLPVDSALARARRSFAALLQLPRTGLVCMRPLNDVNGAPTYPAAVLQEFVDVYRQDATSEDDLDEVYGLPARFRGTLVQRGEELLYANASSSPEDHGQPCAGMPFRRERGEVPDGQRKLVALSRWGADGAVIPGFSPSPSQVETYLECPYKWFAQSRLKVEGLDEGFGPLERGSYSHAVLHEFYRRFQELGHLKVNEGNIAQARALMREVAGELAVAQFAMEPGSGRYVASNQIELRELAACMEQLVSYLDFEVRLLPGFHPAFLERRFAPEDGTRYAGRLFVGTVDRIDVDDAGNAVVIDYKGSLVDEYCIDGATDDSPGKVQARMYAQVVGRELGLNVVGALYVCYGAKRGCAGAYDALALEAGHLPDMRHERCSCRGASLLDEGLEREYSQLSFSGMLDRTEQLVSRAADAMEAGVVDPVPSSADACTYCPVAHCPKRGE